MTVTRHVKEKMWLKEKICRLFLGQLVDLKIYLHTTQLCE